MAQDVSRRLLTAEARVCARVSPCWVCDGQNVTGSAFSRISLVFPCQYHSTVAPYSNIIWGINNRSVGGRSSETQSHPIDMKNKNTVLVIVCCYFAHRCMHDCILFILNRSVKHWSMLLLIRYLKFTFQEFICFQQMLNLKLHICIVTYVRFPWLNNVSTAVTMDNTTLLHFLSYATILDGLSAIVG
jgi:hypothetical protein